MTEEHGQSQTMDGTNGQITNINDRMPPLNDQNQSELLWQTINNYSDPQGRMMENAVTVVGTNNNHGGTMNTIVSDLTEHSDGTPSHYTNIRDVEMYWLQKGNEEGGGESGTRMMVRKRAKVAIFQYIKFVDNDQRFLRPDPDDDDNVAWTIMAKEMKWKPGKERAVKWNTYGRVALDAVRQSRTTAISCIKQCNMKGTYWWTS